MLSPVMTMVIVIVVTLVWIVNFVVSLVNPDYNADPMINVIFMSIVGGALALKRRTSDDEEK